MSGYKLEESGNMNIRRIIYIAVIIFVAIVFFRGFINEPAKDIYGSEPLSQQKLLADFKALPGNTLKDKDSGEVYNVSVMLFPENFKGESGDAFYVEMKKGENHLTIMYRIREVGNNEDEKKLEYVQKNRWENIKLPEQKFEVYQWQNNQWEKLTNT